MIPKIKQPPPDLETMLRMKQDELRGHPPPISRWENFRQSWPTRCPFCLIIMLLGLMSWAGIIIFVIWWILK